AGILRRRSGARRSRGRSRPTRRSLIGLSPRRRVSITRPSPRPGARRNQLGKASPVEKRVGADGKARKAKTPRQRKIAQNKARREKHAEWIERRLVFADKVHRWVRSLSAEQAKGLQNLLEEKEFADTFVFRESLREGVEFNLTGVQASCWRIQMTKEGQRRG